MTYEETDLLLTSYGFTLICFSPLEIECDEDHSTANGVCAKNIIALCMLDRDRENAD